MNGQHVDGETGLQTGELVELVDDHLRAGIALELNLHIVRQVAHAGDVRDDLIPHQLRDALLHHGAVDAVGNIRDVDELAPVLIGDHLHLTAHEHAAAPRAEVLVDTFGAEDVAPRGEVRSLDVGTQLLGGDVRVVDERADTVHDLAEVVRGHVGGHTHGDTRAAVHQQVREGTGEDDRLREVAVVVRLKVHRVLVQVIHQGHTHVGELGLRVSVGSGRVTLRRTEVTLAAHEHIAHVPGLGHVHQGPVGGGVAVRVVFTDGITDDTGTLERALGGHQAQLVHGVKHTALGGLQSVPRIRQRAGDDDGHGVVQEALGHFFRHVHRADSCFIHCLWNW